MTTLLEQTSSPSKAEKAFCQNLKYHLRIIINRMTDEEVMSFLKCDKQTVINLRDDERHVQIDKTLSELLHWIEALNYKVVTQAIPLRPFHGVGAPQPRGRRSNFQYAYGVTAKRKDN